MTSVERLPGDPPSPWEDVYGYSRVVRVGDLVMVGGTTSAGSSGSVIGETPYDQTVEVLRRVLHELARAGASAADVVQIRVFVTDISRADDVGRAFGEVFATVRPIMTMVEVSSLIDPRLWVEIETVAYVGAP